MTINRINFKSSLLTQMQQQAKPVALNQVVAQPQQSTKAKQANKTIIAGGAIAGILIILAIIKRKSITTFFKKLLNKIPKEAQTTIQETTSDIEKQLEEKLKIIPKPNFTCTKESDPKLYKKECKKYADSLIPYVQSEDDDICISAMELLGKYGFTEKHLVELAGFAGTNETEPRIIRAFVNAIADFGIPERSGFISNFLERTDNINLYDTETLKTIINGLDRIGNLEEIKVLEKYLKHDNAEVRELAQKAIKSINARGTYRGH